MPENTFKNVCLECTQLRLEVVDLLFKLLDVGERLFAEVLELITLGVELIPQALNQPRIDSRLAFWFRVQVQVQI